MSFPSPALRDDATSAAPPRTAAALLELSKPGVTSLVTVTLLTGALTAPGQVGAGRLLFSVTGTVCVVAAANALNMYFERGTDALMSRTSGRPLPSGRLAPEAVLAFAGVNALLGLSLLAAFVGRLPTLLTLVALVSYVALYTPLKRVTPLALFAGAVPGALPPLIGWSSVDGSLSTLAWMQFAILFVWQLPHFLAIAMFRREEYARAGLRVLPVVHGVRRTKIEIAVYALLLVLVSLAPIGLGLAGFGYATVALISGLGFLWLATAGLAVENERKWARRVFFASMPYLVVVLGALALFSRA
jgi:protoheme IX farnesyltransferase